MNLENIAWWDEERIASIGSDFRFIADYCVQMRKSSKAGRTRYDPPAGWKIEHVEETLMTLAAFSKDEALREGCWKYFEKFKLNPKKGETTMASVLDHYFEKKEKLYLEREQQYLIKEKEYQAKEKEYQAKEKEWNRQLEKKDLEIESKDVQLARLPGVSWNGRDLPLLKHSTFLAIPRRLARSYNGFCTIKQQSTIKCPVFYQCH
ncbi:hypothetical protein [uncultured Dubosiella sp.]|uniref:hypothetical protein n=1 Tax=uncultured Dubosiella sp. TaxID=1937011 RepID=UPI002611B671|nr:hypothetical protein [uncultured Dubosiella sp.]